MLIAYDTWGREAAAYTGLGRALWTYETGEGVDDVRPVDLDGDGSSEVVIGLNADGGVRVLGAGGRVVWQDRSIGKVWSVTAGPLDNKRLRVVTTSAAGQVHVFSTRGQRVTNLAARGYATTVRFGEQPFVALSGKGANFLATLDPQGWMTKVSEGSGIASIAAAASVPWVGVGTMSGNVYALRAATGAIDGAAGAAGAQGSAPEVVWAKGSPSSLLIVASGRGLRAYRVAQAR